VIRASLISALMAALPGCSGASGMVRDAATGRPIANAALATSNGSWGFSDGQLVWDRQTISTATSGKDGAFRFDVGGGTGLRVRASGYPDIETSFCSRDTLVLMGGPYPQLRADRRLDFAEALGPEDISSRNPPTLANELGVSASGPAFGDGSTLRIEARGGVSFVPGTGAIPPAPPLPYAKAVEVDFREQCGWVFVSDGSAPIAVIEARHPSGSQYPGQDWVYSMMYTPLPVAGVRPD
jgi:hypothetical protein